VFGTLAVLDTLASAQQTVVQYGEDRAFEQIDAARQAHNAQMREMLVGLVEMSTDRQRRYGSQDAMVMEEVDEFGRGQAQKIAAGVTVGFPLRLYDITVQWTRKYMQNATTRELAAQWAAAADADILRVIREVKRGVFLPTNYSFSDRLVDRVDLAVKALVNADGASIPLGPSGTSFNGATHTHYLYTAGVALAAADLTSLIDTVIEHYAAGEVIVWIAKAQEAAVRLLTGFTAYLDTRIVPASTTQTATGSLNVMNPTNRAIGLYGGAEIWVKPWMPAGYLFAYNGGVSPPLVYRERSTAQGDLSIAAEDEAYPLRARTLEREFGIGVWNRTNGAVLFIDAGAAGAYVAPTL
jgi:hypothetical protein